MDGNLPSNPSKHGSLETAVAWGPLTLCVCFCHHSGLQNHAQALFTQHIFEDPTVQVSRRKETPNDHRVVPPAFTQHQGKAHVDTA